MTKRFTKKPLTIEAMRFTYPPSQELLAWLGNKFFQAYLDRCYRKNRPWTPYQKGYMTIRGLEGYMTVTSGDWIIKGVKGEFYPCKPNIFKMTYDPVEE